MEKLLTEVVYVLLSEKIDYADFLKTFFWNLECMEVMRTCLKLDNEMHHVAPSGGTSVGRVSGSSDHMHNVAQMGMDAMQNLW